ncbi:hypothetical protein ACS5PN_03910 [Roseateles sp. NT4]|uniref:hypothetical protein n=1 Tax=Roseateles sp. NT4 TaxID=3453715 RepID=UPI003EE8F3A3
MSSVKPKSWVYVLIFLALSGVLICAYVAGAIGNRELALGCLPLLGTFFGATFAFRLNQAKEHLIEQQRRKDALSWGLFILVRQANAVEGTSLGMDKYRSLPPAHRAFTYPAQKPPDYQDLVHDFADLKFVLDHDPNFFLLLTIEQESFHQAYAALRLRNEFFFEQVHPAIEKAQVNNRVITDDEMEQALGERLYHTLINTTDNALDLFADSRKSLPETIEKMRQVAKQYFPDEKFITFKMKAKLENSGK